MYRLAFDPGATDAGALQRPDHSTFGVCSALNLTARGLANPAKHDFRHQTAAPLAPTGLLPTAYRQGVSWQAAPPRTPALPPHKANHPTDRRRGVTPAGRPGA